MLGYGFILTAAYTNRNVKISIGMHLHHPARNLSRNRLTDPMCTIWNMDARMVVPIVSNTKIHITWYVRDSSCVTCAGW